MQLWVWLTVGLSYLLMLSRSLLNTMGSSGFSCSKLSQPSLLSSCVPSSLEWGYFILAFLALFSILILLYQIFSSSFPLHHSLRTAGRSLLIIVNLHIALVAILSYSYSWFIESIYSGVLAAEFGCLIALGCVVHWNPLILIASDGNRKIRRLASSGLIGLLTQLGIGILLRSSQNGLACPNFPLCLDEFFPNSLTLGTSLSFLHRWWGILMLGLFFHLAFKAAKIMPDLARPTRHILALGLAQVFLGIGNVLSGLNSHSRMLHAAVGYALWGLLFYVAIRAGGFQFIWNTSAFSKAK